MDKHQGKYNFKCGEVMQGCTWQASANSKDELLSKIEEHGRKDHHVTNMNPETKQKVEGAIHQQAA
jgi:predicted small metal-binding protein